MRGLLAAGALVAILGWPGPSGGRPLHPVAPAVQAKQPVALVTAGRRTRLAPLDPATLRIGPRRSAPLGIVQAWAFDPSGEHAVIAAHVRDDERSFDTLKAVDLRSLRLGRRIVRLQGWAQALLWQRADRIVAVVNVCCSGSVEIDAVDPHTRSVVSRAPIRGRVAAVARNRAGLVLLVVPQDRIGPARVVVAGVDGSAREVELPDITAGWTPPSDPTTDPIGTQRVPGLAVDPTGDRAYVVQPSGPTAEIDLGSLAVSYHDLHAAQSVLDRVAAWLQPSAAAKGINGPWWTARWLGDGLLAVTGFDERFTNDANGRQSFTNTPAGLAVLDTHDWTIEMLDPGASAVTVADGVLLATGSTWSSDSEQAGGIGVVAYAPDRSRRLQLFPGAASWVELVLDGRAYVSEGTSDTVRIAVVDLKSGAVVGERTSALPLPLLRDGPDY